MQTSRQCVFAFGDRHQQVGAQRSPDLHLHSVRIGAEETAQVLFDPAKEQFDFPTVLVEQRDGQRIEGKLIGKKD